MYRNKIVLAMVAMAVFAGWTAHAGPDFIAHVGVHQISPDMDDFWDDATGFEIQGRTFEGMFGWALVGGITKFEVTSGAERHLKTSGLEELAVSHGNLKVDELNGDSMGGEGALIISPVTDASVSNVDIDGDVNLLPIGASLLFRPISTDFIEVVFEAGLRVVFAEGGLDVSYDYTTSNTRIGGGTVRQKVKLEEGILGVLAGDVLIAVTENISLFAGAGIQTDIEDVGIDNVDAIYLDDLQLEGVFVRGGVGFRY